MDGNRFVSCWNNHKSGDFKSYPLLHQNYGCLTTFWTAIGCLQFIMLFSDLITWWKELWYVVVGVYFLCTWIVTPSFEFKWIWTSVSTNRKQTFNDSCLIFFYNNSSTISLVNATSVYFKTTETLVKNGHLISDSSVMLQVKGCGEASCDSLFSAPIQGYMFGILSACLSALAGVYTEFLMKKNNDSLYWQNVQLYT